MLALEIASGTAIQFSGVARHLGDHSFGRVKGANEVVFSLNAPADEQCFQSYFEMERSKIMYTLIGFRAVLISVQESSEQNTLKSQPLALEKLKLRYGTHCLC